MKMIVSGSIGNIGRHLVPQLVAAGHNVTTISSQPERAKEIEALGAQAAIGSISDPAFLTATLRGADALFAMTPPNLGGTHVIRNTIEAGKAFAAAIRESGIKRVVMLSSLGADHAGGNGPIAGMHAIENLYEALEGVNVTYLRAGYFYNNFYNDRPLIKSAGIMGGNYGAFVKMPLAAPADIATAAADALQHTGTGKEVRYIVSDVRTPQDIVSELGKAIGRRELQWVEFTDAQANEGMQQAGLPEEIAGLYTEMGAGFREGRLQSDFEKQGSPVEGITKLETFAQDFAKAFQ